MPTEQWAFHLTQKSMKILRNNRFLIKEIQLSAVKPILSKNDAVGLFVMLK